MADRSTGAVMADRSGGAAQRGPIEPVGACGPPGAPGSGAAVGIRSRDALGMTGAGSSGERGRRGGRNVVTLAQIRAGATPDQLHQWALLNACNEPSLVSLPPAAVDCLTIQAPAFAAANLDHLKGLKSPSHTIAVAMAAGADWVCIPWLDSDPLT